MHVAREGKSQRSLFSSSLLRFGSQFHSRSPNQPLPSPLMSGRRSKRAIAPPPLQAGPMAPPPSPPSAGPVAPPPPQAGLVGWGTMALQQATYGPWLGAVPTSASKGGSDSSSNEGLGSGLSESFMDWRVPGGFMSYLQNGHQPSIPLQASLPAVQNRILV